MNPVELGRLRISAVVERAGPTGPTWLLPDATPEAVERHRSWLAPHFMDDKGRFLQSIHTFVVQAPGLTMLVDRCVGNGHDCAVARRRYAARTHAPRRQDDHIAGAGEETLAQ